MAKRIYITEEQFKKLVKEMAYPSNFNMEELESLPGIGPVKARAILEYRSVYGRFVTSEEIMEVRGIGQATYEKIKDRITVR